MSYFGSRYSLLAASVPFSSNSALRGGGERHPAARLLRYPAKGKELHGIKDWLSIITAKPHDRVRY